MQIDNSFIYDFFKSHSLSPVAEDDGSIRIELEGIGGQGRGEIRAVPVIPGIAAANISLELKSCFKKTVPVKGYIEINFCLEGSYEVILSDGQVCYISDSDLSISIPERIRMAASRIPSGHYRGIAFIIKIDEANKALKESFPFLDIDLNNIEARLGSKAQYFLRGRSEVCHLFHEIETASEKLKRKLLPLKTAELLLLLLSGLLEEDEALPQFSRTVIERTRRCYSFLLNHPLERHTSKALSQKYHLAETSLRQCFKSIYGLPIGAFQKEMRIREAEKMLLSESSLSIGEIAYKCGYENQSKFASAFKSMKGKTPALYRKSCAAFASIDEDEALN